MPVEQGVKWIAATQEVRGIMGGLRTCYSRVARMMMKSCFFRENLTVLPDVSSA